MNILILTGRFGMGHLSAANSLKEGIFHKNNCYNIEVIDIFDYITPQYAETIYAGFSFLAKRGSCFYNWFYNQSAQRASNVRPVMCGYFLNEMDKLVKSTKPSVIISTLPLTSQILARYKKRERADWTLVTCITDISSHGEWINDGTDFYLVGSRSVKEQLVQKGVSQDSISVTGIPVKKEFKNCDVTYRNRRSAGGEDKTSSKEKHLLMMGGGLGLLPESPLFYQQLDEMKNLKVTVITGRNEKLCNNLKDKFKTVEVIGFTDHVADYMRKADFIVTKPGGITLFEIINCGKPVLLFSPKLQQEKNNMEFAVRSGIGRVLPEEEERWAEKIAEVLGDDELLNRLQSNVQELKDSWSVNALQEILKNVELSRQDNQKQSVRSYHDCRERIAESEIAGFGNRKVKKKRSNTERGLPA